MHDQAACVSSFIQTESGNRGLKPADGGLGAWESQCRAGGHPLGSVGPKPLHPTIAPGTTDCAQVAQPLIADNNLAEECALFVAWARRAIVAAVI
jgi:hypothetical protein